jgi:hypothetical protein
MKKIQQLWDDEAGVIATTDLVLIATILVIGTIVGLTSIRDQVVQELADVAVGIGSLNQSYSYSAITLAFAGSGTFAGYTFVSPASSFADATDDCDEGEVGGTSSCISIAVAASHESP